MATVVNGGPANADEPGNGEQAPGVGPGKGAVEKALDVLSALVRPGGPHRLAELAKHTGLAKPTVHRMLQTFSDAGFAVSAPGGSYHAGPRLLGMAAAALADSSDSQLARPALVELQRRTGHTVHYAIRNGHSAVYLAKIEPAQAYRMTSQVGGNVPLYCTAVGRAMLARLPEAEVAEILDGRELLARTPRTLTDPADIRAELSALDERGYIVEDEQNEANVRCVAAPVLDGLGQVAGAISVSGLTFTLDEDSIAVFGPLVAEAAEQVSRSLGSQGIGAISRARAFGIIEGGTA
ncbi:IclR family transcriptional regulator [Tamaricihabitans halophyticus]|uniref:IclR family transcriptional regulator n=1 Tax=Tamaricihabitans halophyticus TaxID=1262583 RepID=A0A4R2QEN3_9PSEU|nr:IclR family transcriptional regulator [Tamaricihabitans halophyticus]TCP45425.1 IclR family transcriptional regulator [Tamaricihabitans halophyticus]